MIANLTGTYRLIHWEVINWVLIFSCLWKELLAELARRICHCKNQRCYFVLLLNSRWASLQGPDLEDNWSLSYSSDYTVVIFDNWNPAITMPTICEGKKRCAWFGQVISHMKNIFNFVTWASMSSVENSRDSNSNVLSSSSSKGSSLQW